MVMLDIASRNVCVTAFWASPRFGHPHSPIPSTLGIPGGDAQNTAALTLPKLFQTGKKWGIVNHEFTAE